MKRNEKKEKKAQILRGYDILRNHKMNCDGCKDVYCGLRLFNLGCIEKELEECQDE